MVSDKPTADSIFLAALELPPDQRADLLNKSCGSDQELLARVERLLATQSQVESFLESPAPELGATADHSVLERPGTVIGPYTLVEQIGEGGFGVVFLAEQATPIRRKVALKIVKPGMDTRQVIARFEAERQALAMMDHRGIAKVFDAGVTEQGRSYFVMELVAGVPINEYCDDKHLPIRDRLKLFIEVCQAVQHAHQKGIIHRDIKPNNVLVAEDDNQAVPKVIDFGVAKATAQRLTERTMFTEFGQVLGTMEYMSPEQSKFNQLDIDTRSDIYSLGVLLYELLAGSTPFEGKRLHEAAFDEMLRIIREEEPPKPSTRLTTSDALPSIAAMRNTEPARLGKNIRGELDWIVMKALEKDRNRRYETASGFATDVQRHLDDEAVQACPPSAAYRFRKFFRRNMAALATTGLIVALLLCAVAILSISNARVRRESEAKQLALQQKEAALEGRDQALVVAREKGSLAQNRFYAAQMNLAQRAWDGGEQARTVELLETLRPQEREPDQRGFEWYYLYRLSHPNLIRTWQAHDKIVTGIAWSPDGSMFATCSWDNRLRLWDGRTGEHLDDLAGNGRVRGWDVAFSPDGKFLALAGMNPDGELVVWDVATRRERWRQTAHLVDNGTAKAVFSPDSRVIATSGEGGPKNPKSGNIKLWNIDDGKLLATLVDHKGSVHLAFSPDGETLASADAIYVNDPSIILWGVKLPAVTKQQEVKNVGAAGFIFSEDGQTLFAGNWEGVQMIEVETGTLGHLLRDQPARTHAVRQVPGKKQIVVASQNRTLRLWDLETMQSSVLGAELAAVSALAINSQGDRIACGDNNGRVSLRILADPEVSPSFSGSRSIQSIAFTADGRSLLEAASPLRVLDGSTLKVRVTGPDEALAISPANMLAAVHNPASGRCTIWNVGNRAPGPSMDVGNINHARFSPDGQLLATWYAWTSPTLQLWNTDTGERIDRFDFKAISVLSVAFSPDGRYLAAGLQFRDIAVCDLVKKTWSIHHATTGVDSAYVVDYSPQGNILAAGLDNGGAILFDVDSQSGALKLRERLDGITQRVNAIAFSPKDRTLVTASEDGSVRFNDVATAQERATIKMTVKSLAFSPDGRKLAIADGNETVRLLEAGADAPSEDKSGR